MFFQHSLLTRRLCTINAHVYRRMLCMFSMKIVLGIDVKRTIYNERPVLYSRASVKIKQFFRFPCFFFVRFFLFCILHVQRC